MNTAIAPAPTLPTQTIAPAVEAALLPTPFGQITATQDLAAAVLESGLDFKVETIQMCPKGEPDVDIEGFRGIRRVDTKEVFNCPTESYEVAQNQEVLDFAQPVIKEANGTFTRMGFFKGGASIFAFARLPESLILSPKLTLHQNIVIQSSHDGSASVTIRFLTTGDDTITENLVVPYAGERGKISYRHTRNVRLRMDEVAKLITMKNRYFKRLKEDSEALINSPMTDAQAQTFVGRVLDIDPELPEEKISSRKVEARDTIMRLFRDMGRFDLANTKYAMLLAISEQRSVHAGTRKVGKDMTEAEARFASVFGGASCSDIEWSFDKLIQMVRDEKKVAA